jgi:NAD(P)H-hydrate epimerase
VRRFDPATLGRELDRADVAVDAIFGTGFRGEPEDDWAEAIDGLNLAHVPVVAVDIPSGVDGTSAAVEGVAVRADLTVAFGAAKTGSVLLPGAEFAGDVRVVDIGFPDEPSRQTSSRSFRVARPMRTSGRAERSWSWPDLGG